MFKKKPTPKKLTDLKKRRKRCQFCIDKRKELNYKDVDGLRRYISERGKILHRRITKNCAKHQRMLSKAIKQARNVALLPYTVE
ncbi:MAG: 30S ribosomal protein S18 [bacterium]